MNWKTPQEIMDKYSKIVDCPPKGTIELASISIKETAPEWNKRIEYDPSKHTVVNGITIPIGHYWQSGKIHPIMAKAKKKRK